MSLTKGSKILWILLYNIQKFTTTVFGQVVSPVLSLRLAEPLTQIILYYERNSYSNGFLYSIQIVRKGS